MNAADNARYLTLLENVMKTQKKGGGYYPPEWGNSYRADIQRILQETLKKHPELAYISSDSGVDPRKLPLVFRNNLAEYLKHSRKGAVCYYRDENGETRIMVNAGPGYGSKRNRVLLFPESLKNERPEDFRRILRRALIQEDIKHVYQNLQKQQKARTRGALFSAIKPADKASSAFEREFKALVKGQGGAANPMKTARALVMAMPGGERSRLNSSLIRMNIKNGAELEGLLNQWKYGALGQNVGVTRKQSRDITQLRA